MRTMSALAVVVAALALTGCGDSPEHMLEQAAVSLNAGRPDTALQLAEKLLKEDPKNQAVLLISAKAHLRLRHYDESEAALRQLIALNPSDAEPIRELLTLALVKMADLLAATEFETNVALQESFTTAKELGHAQADWLGTAGNLAVEAEFGRARLMLLDIQRIERGIRLEENKRKGSDALNDPANVTLSSNIEEQKRQVKGMQATAERHLNRVLELQADHFKAAGLLVQLLRQREAWGELWGLAGKLQVRTDLTASLVADLVNSLLIVPDAFQSEARRLDLAQKLLGAVAPDGAQVAQVRLLRARVHLSKKEPEKAIEIAEAVFREQAHDVETRFTYAWALYDTGKFLQAKAILEKLATERRDHEHIQLLYGLTLVRTGEKAMALDAFARTLEINPRNQIARSARVALLHENKDMTTAVIEEVNQLYNQDPSDPNAIRFKFTAEVARGSTEGVRTLLNAVEKISPMKPGHLRALVEGHSFLGNLDKAMKFAVDLQQAAPDDLESHVSVVRVHLRRNEINEARKLLEDLRKKFPQSRDVNHTLAELYLERGVYDRTIEIASDILKDKPDDLDARLLLAQAYRRLSLTEEALEQTRQVLDRHPEDPRALELASSVYQMMGQAELAKAYFDKIDETALKEQTHAGLLAQIRLRKGDLEGALGICQRAIAAGSTDPQVRLTLATIHQAQNNLGEEEVQLLAFVREHPNNYNGYQMLVSFYSRSNTERGIWQFQQLRGGNESLARLAESALLVAVGRRDEAIKSLSEHFDRLLSRKDPLTWTYARSLALLMLQRDRDPANASSVYDKVIAAEMKPAQALGAQLDLRWNFVDDKERLRLLNAMCDRLTSAELNLMAVIVDRFARINQNESALSLLDRWIDQTRPAAVLLALKGDVLLRLNRNADAQAAYLRAIEIEQDSVGLYHRLAQAQVMANQFPAAVATLDRMARIDDGARISALRGKADLLSRLGLNRAAVETLEELQKVSNGSDPRVLLALGQSLIAIERFKDARGALLAVPSFASQYGLAQVYAARIEQTDPATVELAKERLTKLLKNKATATGAATELLRLASRTGDTEQLMAWADQAIQMTDIPKDLRARWLLVRANIKTIEGDWPAVQKAMSDLLAIEPSVVDWQIAQALVLVITDKSKEAATYFSGQTAANANPNGALLAAGLGLPVNSKVSLHPFNEYLVAMASGDRDRAVRAAKAMPNEGSSIFRQDLLDEVKRAADRGDSPQTYRLLAMAAAAQQIGLPEAADVLCQRILAKDPGCIPAHAIALSSLVRQNKNTNAAIERVRASCAGTSLEIYLRVSELQQSDPAKAVEVSEQLLARESDNYIVGLLTVELYARSKQPAKAIALLKEWLNAARGPKAVIANDLAYLMMEHMPENLEEAYAAAKTAVAGLGRSSRVLDTLGWIEHLRGNHKEAIVLLSDAWNGNQDSSDWHYHMGVVYDKLGQRVWSKYHLEAARDAKGSAGKKAEEYLLKLTASSNP